MLQCLWTVNHRLKCVKGHLEHLKDTKGVTDKTPGSPKPSLQAIPGEYQKISLCCLAK